MSNNIANFKLTNFVKSIVKDNNAHFSMPRFRGQLQKDCFEKQNTSEYDFSYIPKNKIEKLNTLNSVDRKDLSEIYDLISKSYSVKSIENAKTDQYFFDELEKNIFDEKYISDKKNKIELTKHLLKLENFSNFDIPIIVNENYLSEEDLKLKMIMANFLNKNENIPNNDFSLIMDKVQTPSNIDMQINAINDFLLKTEYDGDFIPFLIDNLKSKDDVSQKLSCYKSFKNLSCDIKNIFLYNINNVNTENVIKSVKFLEKNGDKLSDLSDYDKKNNIEILCDCINFKEITDKTQLNFKQKNMLFNLLKKHSINLDNFTFANDFPILNPEENDFVEILKELDTEINVSENTDKKIDDITVKDITFIKNDENNKKLFNILLEKIKQDDDYKKLDEKSKKILDLSVAFSISNEPLIELKKFNLENNLNGHDYASLYKILKHRNFLQTDLDKNALYVTMDINNENILNLCSILSKNIKPVLNIENKLAFIKKISEKLSKTNLLLPQTDKNDILKQSKTINIKGNTYNVAESTDIEDFNALTHAVEANLCAVIDKPIKKMQILKTFDNVSSDEVVSCSYINNMNQGKTFDTGFIVNVKPENILAANGYDIHSPRHMELKDVLNKYLFKSENIKHREYISNRIKNIMNIHDEDYKKLINNIYAKYKNENINFEKLEKDFPEVADTMKKIIYNDTEDYEDSLMKDDSSYNEILIRQPKIQAIYTTSLDIIDDSYLNFAKENNLPIVVLKKQK